MNVETNKREEDCSALFTFYYKYKYIYFLLVTALFFIHRARRERVSLTLVSTAATLFYERYYCYTKEGDTTREYDLHKLTRGTPCTSHSPLLSSSTSSSPTVKRPRYPVRSSYNTSQSPRLSRTRISQSGRNKT